MRDAVREIDSLMRHKDVQMVIEPDRWGVVCARYRVPDKHQEEVPGVVNTGRGVMVSVEHGLRHLLNPERRDEDFYAAQVKVAAKKQAKRERKAAADAGQTPDV